MQIGDMPKMREMNMSDVLTDTGAISMPPRFFRCLDECDYRALVGLLSEDALWVRRGKQLIGHKMVEEALAQRNPTRRTVHLLSNLFASRTDHNEIRVTGYLIAINHEGEAIEPTKPAPLKGMETIRTTSVLVRSTPDGPRICEIRNGPILFSRT